MLICKTSKLAKFGAVSSRFVTSSAAPSSTKATTVSKSAASAAGATKSSNDSKDSSKIIEIELPSNSFETYLCEDSTGPSLNLKMSSDHLIKLFTQMTLLRKMEQAADTLYKAKLIRGFCHLAIGQEAVSVGMESAIDSKFDRVITAYRCHTFAVLRGGTVKGVLAELLGRHDGMSKGKGGSMHIFTPTFFGGNGIVGAQVPVGAGLAFAQKYKDKVNPKDAMTFALYGDGAANQGQVFEAFNMAKLWNLPISFVCENNQYGMGTPASKSSMNTNYFKRGDVIRGVKVNAMDILAVHQVCAWAKNSIGQGNGPNLLEMCTYRYGGHSMSDPGTTYRTREEISSMRNKFDSIAGLKARLLEWKVADEEQLRAIDKQAKKEVETAVEEAKASPEPPIENLWSDIYFKGSEPPMMRGREREEIHYYN